MADSIIRTWLAAMHLIAKMFFDGFIYYKKVILELIIAVTLAYCGFLVADTTTQDSWDKMDTFAKRRYRAGEIIIIAGAIKAFFSNAIEMAKKEQKKSEDTAYINKTGINPLV